MAASSEPGPILELRVHGVSNTPPYAMLDLPEGDVAQVAGDDLGSFWQLREGANNPRPGRRGHVPAGITREAYSWGNLARTTLAAPPGIIGTVTAAATRVLWSLLLPFALTNVAYWSRRLHYGGPPTGSGPTTYRALSGHRNGGAWIFRYAGLVLSLITVTTATVISVHLVGVECRPIAVGGTTVCDMLPSAIGFLDSWSLARRVAVTSLVPMVLMLALWALSAYTRTRFEQATRGTQVDPSGTKDAAAQPTSADPDSRWPILARPGFWYHSAVSAPSAHAHLAASLGLVIAVCSADLALVEDDASGVLSWGWRLCTLLGVLAIVGACLVLGGLTTRAADVSLNGAARRRPLLGPGRVLGFSAATYVVFLIRAWTDNALPSGESRNVHATVLPWVVDGLVGVALLLVCLALQVRTGSADPEHPFARFGRTLVAALWFAGGLTLGLLVLGGQLVVAVPVEWVILGSSPIALFFIYWFSRPSTRAGTTNDAAWTGWGGRAPGVFLALALFLCLTVASVLTVFFGDRFNGAASSGALTAYAKRASPSAWFELGPCFVVCPAPAQEPAASLTIPVLYGWFTLIAAVGVLVTIAIVGVLAGRSWRPTPSALLAEAWPAGTWAPTDAADRAATQPCGGGTAPNPATGPVARAVFGRRVLAAIAHRAEPLIALLLTCILGAGLVVFAGHLAFPTWGGWSTALTAGGFALSTFGVLALGLASGTTAGDRPKRPLGIIWDLACLVPRACHPLGPPCYGERVVPELISRMHWWLAGEGDQTVLGSDRAVSTSPRAVIVSAHSLGGPLVVGALLGAPGDPTHDDWMLPRVGLVTYGCQLRAYFSRFFPELYGPAVLGVVPAAAASLRHADPWEGQWTEAGGEVSLPQVLNGSVRWALGGHGADPRSEFAPGRWVNLWRLTDYLGMPVVAMPPRAGMASTGSPMKPLRDWYAEEVDYTAYLLAVLTHSDYPRSEEYNKALDALVGDLHPETAPGSDGPTPTGSAAVAGQARISRTEGEE